MKITADTHMQGMACLNCGLAGVVPPSHFPLEPGLWDQPCPECEASMVWITEIRIKDLATPNLA